MQIVPKQYHQIILPIEAVLDIADLTIEEVWQVD
jgi:hypothetical protein